MKKSLKAALCSALVFPGVGHFILKRHVRALALSVPTVVALTIIGNHTVQMASSIADKILSGEVSPDALTMTALIAATPDNSDVFLLNVATWVVIVCWVVGVVDSWRIGRIEDTANTDDRKN